ncbi:hypothetical protein HanXRQr2_Chr04g0169571 [Helianthus annuus]|nr:hypothetical protein HanXRQr2_Chr04g0169571 [Helianthus annuus]KAJ0589183.1 hypothetical protein HanIR_Chr04g0183161 [Helianthus annuus]KAJ0931564.1 hypothetical protein HanPSC8_Chr04g0163161 [Helianthus annuus]
MFPSVVSLVSLKFQNKARSPFETHRLLANMAVVAYIIAIPMPVALFCLKARLDRESFPHIYYRILQSVFCFWSLLAPLSFVLVLFLPPGFGLIGYIIVFILFIVIVASSFCNYIRLPFKTDLSNLEAHKRNETWSHFALTITEE